MNQQPSNEDISIVTEVEEERKPLNVLRKVQSGALKSVKVVGNVWDDFKEFLNRGNVVDLAVGIVMGAAFTAIVTSLVQDIFTPLISLAIGSSSLDNAFVLMACPPLNATEPNSKRGSIGKDCYASQFGTVAAAKTAGAITWNYGSFIQEVINFIIISIIVFFIVKLYAATFCRKKEEPEEKTTKDCDFCCKEIPLKATKCCFCTSLLEKH
ncbi:hypothetical protein HDV06_006616 [Boothiomyces sp. JEL0866]|nr:hypothetical protein HDV06_006616 [Boothiomyces sp. JEL0866]